MTERAIKFSMAAIAAIALGLVLVTIAGAQSGSDDEPRLESPASTATPTPTELPAGSPPADTDAPPAQTDPPAPTPPVNQESIDQAAPDDDQEDVAVSGTTTALNPAGHCVELPNVSDIVIHPEKHPDWTIEVCVPGEAGLPDGTDDPPADGEELPGEGGGPPEGRTPALNPDGQCVELPNNSDIAQHPEKHPEWTVGGCELSGA
jgi:hypothetical protein